LMGVLTQNSFTVELIKFLEKNQKLYIQIIVVTLKMTSCRSMSKHILKKSENPGLYGHIKLLF
jgi:hypothetical protein